MEELVKLQQECLACRKCEIGGKSLFGKISNVFSNMCIKNGKIMVVGQNPGEQEVRQEKPFVGPSGNFFNTAIKEVLGVGRECFYVCNASRCFTPNNRAPSDTELDNCRHFLIREIEIIKPVIIVTLGNFGLQQITGQTGISRIHGQIIDSKYNIKTLPLYHPSPFNMNRPELKEMFYADLAKLKEYLNG